MLLTLARHSPAGGTGRGNAANEAIEALCRQLRDVTACQDLSERYRASLDFRREFHTRAGPLLVPAVSPPGIFAWPTPPADESATAIARAEIEEIQASMRRVATRVAAAEGARVIVFGHTHRPCLETLEQHTTLVNCGTWGWLSGYDPIEAGIWQGLFAQSDHITPRHYLTYARIDYDEQDTPHAQLLDFSRQQGETTSEEQVGLDRILNRLRQAMGSD
jgi:hypothetical protein